MEGLFFAVHPIWWEGKISIFQGIIFGIVCCSIFCVGWLVNYLASHRRIKPKKTALPEYTIIDPEDTEFAPKTLKQLKGFIALISTPEHSDAHTVREIGKYLFDSPIMEV